MPCPHRFGPAGKPLEFRGDIVGVPEYLKRMGLDAMEYEAVRGVTIRRESAEAFGRKARDFGVVLSLHGPYYVNLASKEERTYFASIERVYQSMAAAHWMGAYAVVIHPGYYGDLPPREALRRVIEGFRTALERALQNGYTYPWLAPETTGRVSQVGTVEEVIEICLALGERCRPTVDWAHIYARSKGERVRTVDDVAKTVELLEKELGKEAVSPLHTHYSKIDFGKGGEKEHHNVSEDLYGPDFEPIVRAYGELGVLGVFISESPALDKDALVMKEICERLYSEGF